MNDVAKAIILFLLIVFLVIVKTKDPFSADRKSSVNWQEIKTCEDMEVHMEKVENLYKLKSGDLVYMELVSDRFKFVEVSGVIYDFHGTLNDLFIYPDDGPPLIKIEPWTIGGDEKGFADLRGMKRPGFSGNGCVAFEVF